MPKRKCFRCKKVLDEQEAFYCGSCCIILGIKPFNDYLTQYLKGFERPFVI